MQRNPVSSESGTAEEVHTILRQLVIAYGGATGWRELHGFECLYGFDRRTRRLLGVPYLNLRYPDQPGSGC